MKLKNQLLALSALTLLLPWSGWKLLQELEHFLREAQENAMLASARTLAVAMPLEYQSRLVFAPDQYLVIRDLQRPPNLDGYADDWPGPGHGLEFRSADGELTVNVLAGSYQDQLYLLFDVHDLTPAYTRTYTDASQADGIQLLLRNPRGLLSFGIWPEAPGPLRLSNEGDETGQMEGFWLDVDTGYRVELALPAAVQNSAVSFQVRDGGQGGAVAEPGGNRAAGSLDQGARQQWISLIEPWQGLSRWLAQTVTGSNRVWLVDRQGWVLAGSGVIASPGTLQTTWLQRLLYRLVAGSRTELVDEWPEEPVRFGDEMVRRALSGKEAIAWSQDMETAVVRNAVSVPVRLEGEVKGAIVMQSASEGLLLVTNRALGRLLFTTMMMTLGLAAGLWFFATRLSQRVRRLSGAVSQAMEDRLDPAGSHQDILPLVSDRDELGELARNNEKLLQAVADYRQYLQTLAGKLSHELKTPLAITRSSLENLASQELNAGSRRFLDRALEGLDRQAAIVRAMSEASRLEASIRVAEWEEIDLRSLVEHCAEAYRSVHPGRRLDIELPGEPASLTCAPELLAQALDKLVDNAVSLTGDQDVVSLVLSSDSGQYQISVRNTGTRLPEEFQERLFDSLVSVREKRGAAPHLGLGLYIVRLVAATHNGSVEARNLPAEGGVEFTMSLPVLQHTPFASR
jgi:two-component system sensor histidine kinase ChvG